MAGAFTRRPDFDPTGIGTWLAGRGGARTVPISPPAATPGPPPVNDDPVAPGLEILDPTDEADNSPDPVEKAEPRKADNCGHCGKPLATLRSAASRYCDRYCAKAARKARATLLPIYYRD
jgi:hypothetical protein